MVALIALVDLERTAFFHLPPNFFEYIASQRIFYFAINSCVTTLQNNEITGF